MYTSYYLTYDSITILTLYIILLHYYTAFIIHTQQDLAKCCAGVEGGLKLTLTGHLNAIRGLAVSNRHPYLFSAAEDKMVKCWVSLIYVYMCIYMYGIYHLY